jgi:hypothetical protein
MKDEDIIGREITCFKFDSDTKLKYSETYKKFEGLPGTVKNLHSNYPEYANVKIIFDGKTQMWHYPTELVKKQLEELDEIIDLDDILLQIKNLIP